jgi:hypothetical protein
MTKGTGVENAVCSLKVGDGGIAQVDSGFGSSFG